MKDLKISKELFEAIYNCDIAIDKDMLDILYKSINLYEFVFKCKEFIVYKKGHNIEIEYCNIDGVHIQIMSLNKGIRRATEVEAVIEACEWILNNK